MLAMYIESFGHCGVAALRSPFPFLGCSDRGKNKIYILLSTGLVSNNTVVVEVSDDRKIRKPCPVRIYIISVTHF